MENVLGVFDSHTSPPVLYYGIQNFLVIGFYSSFKSFEAEDLAQRAGIPVRLIPRPKEVGGELRCGNALRFKPEDKFSLLKLLDKQNIEYTEPVEILDF